MEPRAELIEPPAEYGKSEQPLPWATVRAALEQARQYWLAIPRLEGSPPHVVPLDGVWVDDVWWYGGSPQTLHRRLVDAHRHVTMHLPDPWKCVIVEGEVRTVDRIQDDAQRFADLFSEKYPEYGKAPIEHHMQGLGLHPHRVVAWMSFPADMTRFLFD